jgi:hypothetical protein
VENERLKSTTVEMDKTINASQAECRRLKAEVDSLMTNPTSRLLRAEREENARKIHGLQQDNEALQNRVDFLEGEQS